MALHRKKGTTSNVHFKEFVEFFARVRQYRLSVECSFNGTVFSRRKLLSLE